MRTVVVIPARFGSTRLPGKPLVKLLGKELVLHVIDRAREAHFVDEIVVATDDTRVKRLVQDYGIKAFMTPSECPSGTDRVAHVVKDMECDIVVNLQVDDPTIDPRGIDSAVRALVEDSSVSVATLCKKIEKREEVVSPHVVKVVFDRNNDALYFSRSPIPYERNEGAVYYKHIGPYVFRKDFLLLFTSWKPTLLERVESLEQLRILEHGYKIRLIEVFSESVEVDVPEDLPVAEARLREILKERRREVP